MRKLLLFIFLASSAYTFAQPQKMLPKEIRCADFVLKYEYDDMNRIIKITTGSDGKTVVDSIVYVRTEITPGIFYSSYKIYGYEESGKGDQYQRKDKDPYEYKHGKVKKGVDYLSSDDNGIQFDYVLDTTMRPQQKAGRYWDRYCDCYKNAKYFYDKQGNLTLLTSEKNSNREEMADWEKSLFDAEISYDQRNGIFANINPQSLWILSEPTEQFYPYLHLYNNVSKLRKDINEDEDINSPVKVDYLYTYDSRNYPEKIRQIIINDENEETGNIYTITYQKAQQLPAAPKPLAEPVVSSKKLLPEKIFTEGFSLSYTYDNKNRITSIKQTVSGEVEKHDSITYFPDHMGMVVIDLTDNEVSSIMKYTSHKGNTYGMESEDGTIEYTFTPSGKLEWMISKDAGYNEETSIDPPVMIGYVYDEKGNLIDMDLPNNASGDRVNRSLQMLEYWNLNYDNKNGIFKHVSHESFPFLFDMGNILPCYYFFGNNLRSITEGDSVITHFFYKYNEYDYPSILRSGEASISISYVEANSH
ncbi:hypothetical protein [Dysgonomonas macrotermitis]|uniref:YD repeat-containing protein n=1 Tax=Dysgonomonas macrotermitis TaxID=1346286 RepID=A0A1M5AQC2_9BACT|nr:hypothetical protein [Dysgonomonas macrotermitis]SHF32461.1 hypothetical protein SAMN05444362_105128 [Dysgonomonas macrotermitis]